MQPRLTPRDLEILTALDRCPLTAEQLLKLSRTFPLPFTDERRVCERLHVLAVSGRVRRWQYATAGRGAPNYYTLSPLGYRLLHGDDAPPASKRSFSPVGLSRQHHTLALANFIVHATVLAHNARIRFAGFYRENSVRLDVDEESLYPDCAFQLLPPDGRELSFFVELDNSTERAYSTKQVESWERKLRLYDRFQRHCDRRFRVLIVATRNSDRLDHLLAAAAQIVQHQRRSLFYGTHLDQFLQHPNGLHGGCFRDHLGRDQPLIPGTTPVRQAAGTLVSATPAC